MGNNRIFYQIGSTIFVLVVLYFIWPLPFRYVSKTVLIPTVDFGVNILTKVTEPVVTISKIGDLDDKNKELELENQELKARIIHITEQENKRQSMAKETASVTNTEYRVVQASVIGRSPFSFNQVFILDKGFDDGVRERTAVLSGGYLLGLVTEVSSKSSTVRLITSHDSLIPAMTVDSRQTGIVQGGLAGLVLTDISADAQVAQAEAIVTSGMGGELTPGIPIGSIAKIQERSDGLFMDIKISYLVKQGRVEVVSIVVNDEQS